MTNKMKYWVYELSPKAKKIAREYVSNKISELDLSKEEYNQYMSDFEDEKLGNLDEHLSYDLRLTLSQMDD